MFYHILGVYFRFLEIKFTFCGHSVACIVFMKSSSYLFIVIAAIIRTSNNSGSFLGISSDEINLRVVEDLMVLIGSELVHVELHHLLGGCHHGLRLQEA